MYLRDRNDLPAEKSGYIDGFLVPYFDNVASWHEMMRIGTSCGDIYEMVDRELGLEKFGCTLNPGHLTHTMNGPTRLLSKEDRLRWHPVWHSSVIIRLLATTHS